MSNKTATFCYLTQRVYTKIFACLLTCILTIGLIYIILTILTFFSANEHVHKLFVTTGYIALINLISAPIGYYGSNYIGIHRCKYWALLTYFILASYQVYAYLFYLYFYTDKGELTLKGTFNKTSGQKTDISDGGLLLHKTIITSNIILIAASMYTACSTIIVTTKGIETAKITILDNIASD